MSEGTKRVVIVGASAAGLRCACRLRRLRPDWPVTVVEAAEVYSYAACGLPYVLSGDIDELGALRRTPYGLDRDADFFRAGKDVEILGGSRATAVNVAEHTLTIVGPDGESVIPWDELVLATGAVPRELPNQSRHERVRCFHTWGDVKPLKMGLMRGELEHVAVVGAGLVGCEVTEAFHSLWGAEVTLIEAAETPLPELLDRELGAVVARHVTDAGIRLLTGSAVSAIHPRDDAVTMTVGGDEVTADAVVIAIGVSPRVELATASGVDLGPSRAIRVDERLATSVPHVWAAGDCVECRHAATGGPAFLPLGSLANRQGRVLGNILAGREDRFGPVAAATAVKVFDLNVAAVGCTASRLSGDGLGVRSIWLSGEDRAHYWPEAQLLLLTLVYDPSSHRIVGLQAVGEKAEAPKRVDVAAQLLLRGATIEDLTAIEHAYAPPFAPALDPLAVLAMAAGNQLEGIDAVSPLSDLSAATVLDIRTDEERSERPLQAAELVEIDYTELRRREGELPDGPLVVACAHGTRSSEVVRWLHHRGLDARYLGGGMSWRVRALGAS